MPASCRFADLVGAVLAGGLTIAPASAQQVTTVITHGFQLDSCEGRVRDITLTWMRDVGDAIIARSGSQGAVMRYDVSSGQWLTISGSAVAGEPIVLLFDWIAESDGDILGSCPPPGANWGYAQAAGDALHAALRDPTPGPTLPFNPVRDRVLHFIGHSRGTVVNSYAVGRLADEGVIVDQVTTLDPHPVNGTLDICFIPATTNWGDNTPIKWANVVWADNYWRADGTDTFLACDFDGMELNPAQVFNLRLNDVFGEPTSPGGGSDPNLAGTCEAEHTKVPAWYTGTIPLNPPVMYPNGCPIEYAAWFPPGPGPGAGGSEGYDLSHLGSLTGGAGHGSLPGTPPAHLHILYNGSFDQSSVAGWNYHGGSAGGSFGSIAGNPYLRLTSAAPQARHNRFFIRDCGSRTLTLRALRESAPGMDDRLRVTISRADGSASADVIGPVPVSSLSTSFTTVSGAIPGAFNGQACLLTIQLDDAAGGAISSTIGIDDVIITGPPDFDANGTVNGLDLAILLGQWTGAATYVPCPPLRPADLNGDCRVNGLDLAMLLGAWGMCR